MGYNYTPAYYSTFQDSIASICKSILPFSLKNRRLTAAEQKLSKQQSDNLKWQQNSFHQILNMMGLHKEGMLPSSQLAAFRSHILETLIASKAGEYEQPTVLRDKLLFLQELLYAKCITAEEYHASKRPLIQRLAVQGAEIEASDVIVGEPNESPDEEEWSVIDLRDEHSLLNKDDLKFKNKFKNGTSSAMKQIKDTASVLGIGSLQKLGKSKQQKSIFDLAANDQTHNSIDNVGIPSDENAQAQTGVNPILESETKTLLMSEILSAGTENTGAGCQETDKGKRKPFKSLFRKEAKNGIEEGEKSKVKEQKSAKKQWGFDGFKKWKWSDDKEDETTPLPLGEKSSDCENYMESSKMVASPAGEGPDSKQIKRKVLADNPSPGFIIDKVLGDKIKKELSRIQTELSCRYPDFQFSDYQMNGICTKLPVDKSDLKQFFPKAWCEEYGDIVLDVVKKQLKDHVGENETMRNAALERRQTSSRRWTTFDDDDENFNPNLFASQTNKKSGFWPDQNPFWNGSPVQGI